MPSQFYRPFQTVGHLGMELKRLRQAAGFTQATLARRADVSRRWLSQTERGHPGGEIANLMKVVRALDLSLRFERPSRANES